MLVIFVGPPGTGKGTQSKRLVEYLDALHLSTGELLRDAIEQGSDWGRDVKGYLDQGQLVPCDMMIDLIADRLHQISPDQNLLLDGFPRTIHQAEQLDVLLEKLGRSIRHVLALDTDRDELRRRLIDRAVDEGRSDDSPDTIARRLEIYDARTAPLIDYYRQESLLRTIDGMGSPDDVFRRIQQALAVVDN